MKRLGVLTSASGRADLALVVGGLGLVAAIVALVGGRRQPSPAPPTGSEQDR